jgi:hypothetical protein
MRSPIRRHGPLLAAGLLLTFASAFGQTWFLALFAGEIKADFGLSEGAWGTLYTAATLGAAGLLFARGALADRSRPGRLAPLVAVLFAAAATALAVSPSIATLCLALERRRGRGVALATLGYSAGEILLSFPAILLLAAVGWRAAWGVVALALLVVVAPLLALLLRGGAGSAASVGEGAPGIGNRHWTRAQAVRHWLFPALLPISFTPGFVGTVVFFHQAHIAETKGWTLAALAPGYPAYAACTVVAALGAGALADRLGPDRLLPVLLVPMGLGVAVIASATAAPGWALGLGLVGLTQGASSALWGAFLPAVYGTRHLGEVRALSTTVMLVATAIGPGLTGLLIDAGIDLSRQCLAMGVWCLALSLLALPIRRGLAAEALPAQGVYP